MKQGIRVWLLQAGDVLTGIIAGFLAQGLSPFDSGKLGVYCHGLAGDIGSLDMGENVD